MHQPRQVKHTWTSTSSPEMAWSAEKTLEGYALKDMTFKVPPSHGARIQRRMPTICELESGAGKDLIRRKCRKRTISRGLVRRLLLLSNHLYLQSHSSQASNSHFLDIAYHFKMRPSGN